MTLDTAEPYILTLDLTTGCVHEPTGDVPPNLPRFRMARTSGPDTTSYQIEPEGVRICTHWLATSPLYVLKEQEKFFFAHSIADLSHVGALTANKSRIATLVRSKGHDGPGDPIFSSIIVAHPGDQIHVHLPSRELRVDRLPEERTSEIVALPEGKIEDALCSSILEMLSGATKVAFALSGGVDSTTLAALGNRLLSSKPLLCFTAQTHGGDDLYYAEIAARALGADLHIVNIPTDKDALALHAAATTAACHPIPFSGNSIGFGAICQAAKQLGVDVIVDGTGGDPIFGGVYSLHGSYWARAEGLDRTGTQFQQFLEGLQKTERSKRKIAEILREPNSRIDYGLHMRREITRGAMARWRSHHIANGRAHDVRIVMPYLNETVASFIWNEPTAFFQGGWNKAPLRRILQKYVPEEVAWRRSSQGLRWPIAPFFKQNRRTMSRYLSHSGLRQVVPMFWALGTVGALPDGCFGRLYSAALAYDAAQSIYLNRHRRRAERASM